MSKINKDKTAKLISLTTATLLIALILASSLYYSGGNITANVIAEDSSNFIAPLIREVKDISELKYLNEGWYEIRNGYVFYLESFDSFIPLNLKVKNPSGLNGLAVVDADGSIEFTYYYKKSAEMQYPEEYPKDQQESQNLITGDVTGLEGISGMQTANRPPTLNGVTSYTYYYNIPGTNRYVRTSESSSSFSMVIGTYDPTTSYLTVESHYGPSSLGEIGSRISVSESSANSIITRYDSSGQARNWIPVFNSGSSTDSHYITFIEGGSSSRGGAPNSVLARAADNQHNNLVPYKRLGPDSVLAFSSFQSTRDPPAATAASPAAPPPASGAPIAPTTAPPTPPTPGTPAAPTAPTPPAATARQPSTYQELLDQVLAKTSDDFISSSQAMARSLNIDHEELLRTIWRETGGTFSPAEPNRAGSNAVGLIQFTPSTIETLAAHLNKRPQDFPRGNAVAQLQWVEEYFKYKRDVDKVDITRRGELHLSVFAPAAVGQSNSFVAYRQGTPEYELNRNVDIDGNGQITRGEIDDFYIRGLSAPPGIPTLPGFTQPGQVPQLPQIDSSNTQNLFNNLRVGERKIDSGGVMWGKGENGVIYKLENNVWVRQEFDFDVSVKLSDGTPITERIKATSPEDARRQANAMFQGLNPQVSLSTGQAPPTVASDRWKVVTLPSGQTYVSNGRNAKSIPAGQQAQNYADELNQVDDIQNDYNRLKSELGSQLTEDQIFNIFLQSRRSGGSEELIKRALARQTTGTAAQQTDPLKPVTRLDNRQYLFVYDGKPYYSSTEKPPKNLVDSVNFNKNHPRAVEEKGAFITINNAQYKVYREGNNYIDETGNPITTSFQRTRTIGEGADAIRVAEIVDVNTRRSSGIKATSARNGVTLDLDQETLRQIEQTKGVGVTFGLEEGETVIYPDGSRTIYGQNGIIRFRDANGQLVEITTSPDFGQSKGTKKEERFREVYLDDNGRELSRQQLEACIKDSSCPPPIIEKQFEKNQKDGTLTSSVSLTYRRISRDGRNIRIGEGVNIDERGRYNGFVYTEREGDQLKEVILDKDGRPIGGNYQNDPEFNKRGKKLEDQYESRQFFANLERVFTEYRGLGYIPGLFMDEEKLLKWRQDVDQFFTDNYLGIEAWTSKICDEKIEHGQSQGVAYAETPKGLAQIGAHIEATRTQPIINLSDNTASYIYKITFNVRNGDYEKDVRAPENMSINVVIKGFDSIPTTQAVPRSETREVKILKKDISIPRGSSFGKMGSSAIVKETKSYYTRICIKFDKIPVKWKIDNNELCNAVQGASGEPTTLRAQGQLSRQGTDTELNDF